MEHDRKTVSGEVTDVFAHRFVVATEGGRILADLGPKGAESVALRVGDRVEITGEQKPSELKVARVVRPGRETVEIVHGPKKGGDDEHSHDRGPVDPGPALKAVAASGYTVVGEPSRKPKHFEIIGRDAAGNTAEFHVAFDGAIRKTKPAGASAA